MKSVFGNAAAVFVAATVSAGFSGVARADEGDDLRNDPDVIVIDEVTGDLGDDNALPPPDDDIPTGTELRAYQTVGIGGVTYTVIPGPNWSYTSQGALAGAIKDGLKGGPTGAVTGFLTGGVAGYTIGGLYHPTLYLVPQPKSVYAQNGLLTCLGVNNLTYLSSSCR